MFLQKKQRAQQKTEASRVGATVRSTSSRTSRDFAPLADEAEAVVRVWDRIRAKIEATSPGPLLPKLSNASPYIASDFAIKYTVVNGLIKFLLEARSSQENGEAEFSTASNFLGKVEQHLHVHDHVIGMNEYVSFRHELNDFRSEVKMVINSYFLFYVASIRKIKYNIAVFEGTRRDNAQVFNEAAVAGVVNGIYELAELDVKLRDFKI